MSPGCFCWKSLLPAKSAWCDDRRFERNIDTSGNWRWFRCGKSRESSYPGSPDSKQICQQTFLCIFVDLKPFTLTRIWSSMYVAQNRVCQQNPRRKQNRISLPVPKEVSNENSFLHKMFCLPRVVFGSWNLQKGESLEVAMEILGTSPLGDEEASIVFPWKPWWTEPANRGGRMEGNISDVEKWLVHFFLLLFFVRGNFYLGRKITSRYPEVLYVFLVMGFLVVFP